MESIPAGRTPWEAEQYQADRGRRAAIAEAFTELGAFIAADADGPLPVGPTTVYASVPPGPDEQRKAAVDRWAARHGVSACWNGGRYEAVACFGEAELAVHFMPASAMDAWHARDSYRQNVQVPA